MENQMSNPLAAFDPRARLLVLLITCAAVVPADRLALLWIIGFMSVYLLVQGLYGSAVRFLLLTALLLPLQVWAEASGQGVLLMVALLSFITLRMLPVFMAAVALAAAPVGQLVAALRRWRMPMGILAALAVGARFVPVVKLEYEAIRMSARLRGLSVASPRNWLRPLAAFEYAIVPLLMRSLKIADELAAAATTKGIDYPGRKSSLYPVAWRRRDSIVLMLYIGWLCAGLYLGGMRWL